jgi:uncharacterized protein
MTEGSPLKNRYVPQRTCLGCARKDDQKKLIRIIIGAEGELVVNPKGTGRGGYLHPGPACWQAFVRRKNTHRAFRVNLSKDSKEKLIQLLKEGYQE